VEVRCSRCSQSVVAVAVAVAVAVVPVVPVRVGVSPSNVECDVVLPPPVTPY
jgi:hypothetical protein